MSLHVRRCACKTEWGVCVSVSVSEYEGEAPAVSVNTNEIIPQRQPETLPVGIFVHVILICSNPFRDNPNLRPLFSPQPSSASFYFLSADVGHLRGVRPRKQLHLHEDGRHDGDRFPAAAHRSLQRGENYSPYPNGSACLWRKNPVPPGSECVSGSFTP